MLVFIDESGDSGLKIDQGSSRFFAVSLVAFEDIEEAESCDQKIELLKRELGWSKDREFHFAHNSHRVRCAFLEAVAPYNFFYYGIAVNKDPAKLYGDGFRVKDSFYKYTCGLVIENAKEKLDNSTIVIDKSGSTDFRHQLAKYLKSRINTNRRVIKKVKMQGSSGNNLLQLADYVVGVISRSVQNGKNAGEYKRLIAHREMYVQVWPK